MSETKSVLIWVVACSILGIVFGYLFNTDGIRIVATIWFVIGCAVSFMLPDSGHFPAEPIAGWFMFGISLGATVALVNYESWLSPLLK